MQVMDLVESVRSYYGRYCGDTLEGYRGFINGYCLGANIDAGPFWDGMQAVIHGFLPADDKEVGWGERLHRSAPVAAAEISIMYAAIDWHRKTVYRDAWSHQTLKEWRENYVANQTRFNERASPIPAPHQLVFAQSDSGQVRLFHFDAAGRRYLETSMRSIEAAKRWATNVIGIDEDGWVGESPGLFNKPYG